MNIRTGRNIKKDRHGRIVNYFRRKNDKNILICYIVAPFCTDCKRVTHTNFLMALSIAKIFDDHKYNVDIIDWSNEYHFSLDKYNVVFGFGSNLRRAVDHAGIYTIAFLTGASEYWSNIAELRRVREAEKRTGKRFRLRRNCTSLVDLGKAMDTDAAICHGNQWTVSTWEMLYSRIWRINGFGFQPLEISERDDIKRLKYNFCFFSGAGNIHKGLDICLETFKNLPNCHLYIATKLDDDFREAYAEYLESPNVHYVGFIEVESETYKELCRKCLFSILLSCSEGQATSVLTNMSNGMIPVVTENCGIDVEEIGFLVADVTVESVTDRISAIIDVADNILSDMAVKVKIRAHDNYTQEAFEQNFDRIIGEIEEEIKNESSAY